MPEQLTDAEFDALRDKLSTIETDGNDLAELVRSLADYAQRMRDAKSKLKWKRFDINECETWPKRPYPKLDIAIIPSTFSEPYLVEENGLLFILCFAWSFKKPGWISIEQPQYAGDFTTFPCNKCNYILLSDIPHPEDSKED